MSIEIEALRGIVMVNEIILDTDDRAAQLVTLTGWVSHGGNFFGSEEKLARYDGCTHRACTKCGAPAEKLYFTCSSCREVANLNRYADRPVMDWDGETPLFSEALGKYIYDYEMLCDLLDIFDQSSVDDLRLVICAPNFMPELDPSHWDDHIPDDSDLPDVIYEALQVFNEVIRDQTEPLSWSPGKFAAKVALS